MGKYNKAIAAAVVSVVGLGVTFGYFTDAEAQQVSAAVVAVLDVLVVYFVPNQG